MALFFNLLKTLVMFPYALYLRAKENNWVILYYGLCCIAIGGALAGTSRAACQTSPAGFDILI